MALPVDASPPLSHECDQWDSNPHAKNAAASTTAASTIPPPSRYPMMALDEPILPGGDLSARPAVQQLCLNIRARPALPDLNFATVAHRRVELFEVRTDLDDNLRLAIALGRNVDRH